MMRTPEEIFCKVCSEKRGVNPETLKHTVILAVEIAREGREGRKIGTLFVVGDSDEVLKHSRSLILDPLFGHPDELKLIHLPDMRETVKELAQLDGAFVVSDAGCRGLGLPVHRRFFRGDYASPGPGKSTYGGSFHHQADRGRGGCRVRELHRARLR